MGAIVEEGGESEVSNIQDERKTLKVKRDHVPMSVKGRFLNDVRHE